MPLCYTALGAKLFICELIASFVQVQTEDLVGAFKISILEIIFLYP